MYSRYHIILPLVCALSFAACSGGNDYAVRHVTWGMSKAEVVASESSAAIGNVPDRVAFADTIAAHPVMIAYYFEDDELVKAGIAFELEEADSLLVIERHDEVKALLQAKYGPESYSLAPDGYRGSIVTEWNLARTRIRLGLTSADPVFDLGIVFEDQALIKEIKEQGPPEEWLEDL